MCTVKPVGSTQGFRKFGISHINAVGIDYKELPNDVKSGDLLLLNDGLIQLTVDSVDGALVHTTVTVGGVLSNNKGINRLGGGLTAPAFTEKDKEDLITAAEIDVDYIAVSFPRSGDDMRYVRSLAEAAGSKLGKLLAVQEGSGPCLGRWSTNAGTDDDYYYRSAGAPPPPPPAPMASMDSVVVTAARIGRKNVTITQADIDALDLPSDTRKQSISSSVCMIYAAGN